MYCVREVTKDLYWVGANDHRLHLFENIHPIPQGVSYNAYLLKDNGCNVLFDTVDWSAFRQMEENIKYLLEGETLDYLLINHLEPDHAASIEEILRIYPKVKIISTEKGFMMMRQFGFSCDDHEEITVGEGDTFTFKDHTVAFVMAPMVHWPEAMVTLDVTNGCLFSADGFGSFIALDGKLFADEVNFDRDWLDECRRYLTNIVGKYGAQTQALLGKAATVLDKIKIICPLHGPVWRKDLLYIIDKYDKWSKYEAEEDGVVLIYGSMYGNTESAAQALAAKIVEKGVTNVKVYDASQTHVSYLVADAFKYTHIALCSCTYNLNIYPPVENFLHHIQHLNLQNRTVAIMENGTWAPKSGDLMEKYVNEKLKKMTVLGDRVTMASSLKADQAADLDALAQTIVDSVQKEAAARAKK